MCVLQRQNGDNPFTQRRRRNTLSSHRARLHTAARRQPPCPRLLHLALQHATLALMCRRITAAAALKHRYLVALHNVNEEPVAEPFDFRFENEKVSEQDLKKLCWQQLLEYHKDLGGRKAYRI